MSSWYKFRPCLWNVQPKGFLVGIRNLSHVLNATFDDSGFKNKFHISCHQTMGRAWIQGLEKTHCKVQSCVKSFYLGSDSVSSTLTLEVLGYRGKQSGCIFTWNYGSAICLAHMQGSTNNVGERVAGNEDEQERMHFSFTWGVSSLVLQNFINSIISSVLQISWQQQQCHHGNSRHHHSACHNCCQITFSDLDLAG